MEESPDRESGAGGADGAPPRAARGATAPPGQATTRDPGRILLMAAAFVVLVAGMRAAEAILVPFLLALFIAVICTPALFWLERRGLPRWGALLVVIGILAAAGFALTAVVQSSVRKFVADLPRYQEQLSAQTTAAGEWLKGTGLPLPQDGVQQLLDPARMLDLAGLAFSSLGSILANAFLIFLMVAFILFEAATFPRKLAELLPDPKRSLAPWRGFTERLNRYLVIKTATSLATGLIIGLWLHLLGLDFAVLWGLLAFLLNFVPNIGSIIAAVPPLLLALVQLGPVGTSWVAIAYLAVNNVIGVVVEPRFLGRGVGLSTLVVFLSLVFWGWVLGPVGMFLSVPLTMAVKIGLESREDTRWLAVLLGPAHAAPSPPAASANPGSASMPGRRGESGR